MKAENFLNNLRVSIDTNKKLLISNLLLSFLLLLSVYQNFSSDEIVILKANPYCHDVALGENFINEANQQRLSVFIASVMGNLSPKNTHYQSETILSYANPSIYKEVKEIINVEFEALKRENISIDFTAENVFTENGVTFVSGTNKIKGATGITKRHIRTYEFKWRVTYYSPTFTYVNVYDDKPHDENWKLSMK